MEATNPFSRRTFLSAAAAAGAALAADSLLPNESHAAAADSFLPNESRAARSASPVEISYWFPFGGDSELSELKRAKLFSAAHPDIKINALYVPPHSGVDNGKLLAAIAAGNPPDLVVCDLTYGVAAMGYQGGLVDLAPYLKQVGWQPSHMVPAALPLMQYPYPNGKLWGMPQDGNLTYFFINKTLFRKAGLDPNKPPTTTAQLDAYAAKLTTFGSGGRFKTIGFIPWAYDGGGAGGGAFTWPWVFGANFTKVVNGKVMLTLTDPAFIRALNWEATYAKKYGSDKLQTAVNSMGNSFSPSDPFLAGQLAMMVGGNYHTEALRTYNPTLDYAVWRIPAPPGGRSNATMLGTNVFMVPRGAKHPLEAVKVALGFATGGSEVATEDIWRTFSMYKQGPNSPKCIWQQRHDPTYALELQLAASPNATNPPLLPISAQLANSVWTAAQDVIYGKATAEHALSQVQSQLQPLLDQALHQ